MSKRSAPPQSSDLLEWTITSAPTEDEGLPAPFEPSTPFDSRAPQNPTTRLRSPHARQFGLILIGLLAAAMLGLWLVPTLGDYRVRQTVRQVIAAEEQAALARDAARFKQFSEARYTVWAEAQARRARVGQAAPLPSPLLRPVPEAGRVRSFKLLAPEIILVEVARQFIAPDGRTFKFVLPQFYRFNGQWQRIPPPEGYWGERHKLPGQRIDVNYFPVDAAFAADLSRYLEDVLARACAVWACPDDLHLTVNLANTYYQTDEDLPALIPSDPLLFALLPPHVTRWPDYVLLVSSPHAAGYPAEAAGADLLKRGIAAQALFATADQLTFKRDYVEQPGNAFYYALVARLSASLGVDGEGITYLRTVRGRVRLDGLWANRTGSGRRPNEARIALVLLNTLLAGQAQPAEVALFHNWRSATGPEVWLAQSLGISVEEAQAQLESAARAISDAESTSPP
ncbi:MAG: hypothetical protein ACRDH2_16170 [Anaerolineales bacterium]